MATDRISTRIDEHTKSELAAIARARGTTESQLIREALEEFCSEHAHGASLYERARQDGLIGCIKSGPSDLSTSKKHMKGFGGGR